MIRCPHFETVTTRDARPSIAGNRREADSRCEAQRLRSYDRCTVVNSEVEVPVKFLVLWQLRLELLSPELARAVAAVPEYGEMLEREGKVVARYHVVGAHGGAWIYDVESHEEFERLLGQSPVFNYAEYTVYPLADMTPAVPPASGPGDQTADQNSY